MTLEQEITIRHIRTLKEFAALKESWTLLLESRKHKTAFLTWEWMHSWLKNHAEAGTLWIVTAWCGNELIGVAPLMLVSSNRMGLKSRILRSIGKPNTDESDVITSGNPEEIIPLLFGYIHANRNEWDAIELCELNSEENNTAIILREMQNLKLKVTSSTNSHFHIQTTDNWDEYWHSLSKNTRDSVKKRLKHAEKNLNLEFHYIKGSLLNWGHFEAIFDINQRSRFPEKYSSAQERAHLRDLFEAMQSKGWLEVIMLYMDGKPVAYDYGFNMDGKFEDWRTGYDLQYSGSAAGKLLLYLMLKYQFENGYKDFDFLRGAYEYKTQWNPKDREYLNIIAVKPKHLQSRLALITLPKMWHWFKRTLLKRTPA
ncbi:hypothetical protein MASR2M66_17120 [Chloroflexota bacterium]